MSEPKCQCNHHKITHRFGNCMGLYQGGDRCDCNEYRPMTEAQQAAVSAIEGMVRR